MNYWCTDNLTHLKINNKIDNPLWKKMECHCSHDGNVEHDYPIFNCLHCKFEECENSCPTESWFVNEPIFDKDNKPTGEMIQKEVKEITLVNGKYGDLIGWSY